MFRVFPKAKNSVSYVEFTIGSKFYFSQWKTYFSRFIAKFWNFVVIPDSLYYVWNVNSLILCKLPTLFSTVKPKLGHNFSQFIHRFKIGIFECWSWVVLPICLQFTNKFFDFSMLLLLDFSVFPNSWEK